jgi:Putative adhesin
MPGIAIPSIDHTVGPDGLVVLKLRGGTLRLHGVDGDTVRIRPADADDLDRLVVERGVGSISVSTASGGGSPDLDVDLPTGATIVAEGGSTDVFVEGLNGDQRYRTVSGDMQLRRVHGPIAVDAVSGDVDIIADGPSTVVARTVSGDLALRAGTLGSLHAITTSGDLRIAGRFEGDGPFGLETVSGTATLAPAGDVRVEVSTITGDVRSDVESRIEGSRGLRSVIIGTGDPTVTFRSTSGDLRVVRAATLSSAEPPPPPAPPTPPALAALPDVSRDEPTETGSATDVRLETLRALERGEIDIEEASRRLEEADLDESDDA